MPTGSENLQGPRLEFVIRKLPGTVVRMKTLPPATKAQRDKNPELDAMTANQQVQVVEDAGWMLYLPTGEAYRLSNDEMLRRKYDREPNIIGFEQANDIKTAAGRFKLARNDSARNRAWAELENEIIKVCQGRFGSVEALLEGYDPHGKLKEAA